MEDFKIFIWQSSIEHHEYYTWLSLHSLMEKKGRVTFVLGQMENDIRKSQGWKAVDLSKLNIIFIPSKKLWGDGKKLIIENPDAIHIFLAFTGTKKGYDFFPLILFSLFKKIKVAVINEPYSTSPVGYFDDKQPLYAYIKAWVRPILYRGIAILINFFSKSEKPCILPISIIAKVQFTKCGFEPGSMFPFGWFVPNISKDPPPPKKESALRIIFIGAVIKRKGLDILIRALKLIRSQGYNVTLDVYGPGNKHSVDDLGEPFCHKGFMPFEEVQSTLQKYDLLILPSRHDGWGVVVNEALLQGVPVIVSSKVGAKQLVDASGAGLVFESENLVDLAEKIKMVINNPIKLNEMKKCANLVSQQILPEHGAQYLLDVLMYYFYKVGSRPTAIWSNEYN